MLIKAIRALALSGAFIATTAMSATITESFTNNPAADGWQVFGDPGLFHWDSQNNDLAVTWDSTRQNSYFCHFLGTSIDRNDDFTVSFDLYLNDIVSGNVPGEISPIQIAIGFLNYTNATSDGYSAPNGTADNLVELQIYPFGYYVDDSGHTNYIPPTIAPTFISSVGDYQLFSFAPYEIQFPTNVSVHVSMNYTASNQTLATLLTTNGQVFSQLQNIVLNDPNTSGFTSDDNYLVDTFSITSYSGADQNYSSVLAHGTVANISVTYPFPIQAFTGTISNGIWTSQFLSRGNWLYTLQRTSDFASWTNVTGSTAGNGTNLTLLDTNPPPDKAYYRVQAGRP